MARFPQLPELSRAMHKILRIKIVQQATLLALMTASIQVATFRFASTSNRIYVEGGGTVTLTDIKTALPNAPLDLVDGVGLVWLLRANLVMADGCVLLLHGSAAGGDVNEL